MQQNKFSMPVFTIVLLLSVLGCAPSREVKRIGEESVTDLSGDWNDTDSRLVAEEMVSDLTQRPLLQEYQRTTGKKAVLTVGKIENRSHEHIEVKTFIKDLERSLVNSGIVEFVASSDENKQLIDELVRQAQQASPATQKNPGQAIGADFIMIGSIVSILDQEGGEQVKFYQVNLELVNVETFVKAWIGEKKIKKLVSRGRLKF